MVVLESLGLVGGSSISVGTIVGESVTKWWRFSLWDLWEARPSLLEPLLVSQ